MSTPKGNVGEIAVMKDLVSRGYKISLPWSEDCPYDVILDRDGKLEKVQVKYSVSKGVVIKVRARHKLGNTSTGVRKAYTSDMIDWLAVYDASTDQCFYISKESLGQTSFELRLKPTKTKQIKHIRWAKDYKNI
jgi:hypothetical protein